MGIKKLLAWGAHLYTATGLVAAAGIAVLLVRGGAESFRLAFFLMVIATAIDTTDGLLARKAKVKEFTPGFDGRRLDDLIDFHTYTTLPLLFIWRAGILPAGQEWWLLLPLLASAYGFCQVQAKTADNYFLGFPSYWNIVGFYLYILKLPEWFSLGAIIVLALLTFVPSRYLYTTHGGPFSLLTNVLGSAWGVSLILILVQMPDVSGTLIYVSLIFPVYYMVLSWAITIRYWLGERRRELSLHYELSPDRAVSED
ncbi:MAG TPA: CDP-alcohol phosphatidyltransferase family protein [Blastocatellia bacterium]|nr:CDP-alcohol phosphatidyltransferase family protein [Blastocatellia bacterium]